MDVLLLSLGFSWLIASVVFSAVAVDFKDRLLSNMSVSFMLIGVSEIVPALGLVNNLYVEDITLILKSMAAYTLIIGAVNGSDRFRLTKYLLLLSLGAGIFSRIILRNVPSVIGPTIFAMLVGFGFTSFSFFNGGISHKFRNCLSYKLCGILFLIITATELISYMLMKFDIEIVKMVLGIVTIASVSLIASISKILASDREFVKFGGTS